MDEPTDPETRAETVGTPKSDPGGGKPWFKWLGRAAIVSFIALAGFLLWRTLREYSLTELVDAITRFPLNRLGYAAFFAAASYLSLTCFDWLGTRYVRRPLAYRRVALASFVSLSLGHSIGFAGLSSGVIRYRFYSRWGLRVQEVAKLILFSGLTVGLGLATLGSLATLVRPEIAADVMGLGVPATMAVGGLAAVAVVLYLIGSAFLRRPLQIRSFQLEMPPLKLAVGQVVVGTINFMLVAACLHQAILGLADVPYTSAATVYVLANAGVMITHVPGGLGIIEAVVLTLLSEARLIASLLVFRFVYFIAPLALGAICFGATEAIWRLRQGKKLGRQINTKPAR
ncbi:hypothetical protein FP2506_17599 [Fulvimarina pelagi HTCC2506]|uniref:Uncharacterized protein n=1 Tax=Fulvimarina pelagi HTCC2506 TaxID=314231 RepID=Q0FY28_9HYPH|nr:hypothetical protein FP2506_17599 [Fulvimarina pelagi HTCC2506]